jgi:hypothetical protein
VSPGRTYIQAYDCARAASVLEPRGPVCALRAVECEPDLYVGAVRCGACHPETHRFLMGEQARRRSPVPRISTSSCCPTTPCLIQEIPISNVTISG